MNNKFLIISALFCVIVLTGCGQPNTSETDTNTIPEAQNSANMSVMPIVVKKADTIEVVHFHGTQQCWSCITVGEYALKTIQERFPKEYKSGKIVFREINGELPENRDIVIKYQARGSSLFVNAITDGVDSIKEDVTVWRLVSDENNFMNYFESKLKELLG